MKSALIPDQLFFGAERMVDLSEFLEKDKSAKAVKVRGIVNILNDYVFTIKEAESVADVGDEKERDELKAQIEYDFEKRVDFPDYARKLYVIEHCIFGSDIQPIAVQISRLRFFITLLCEQAKTDDPEKNYGITPLPNLENNFVAANSLLSIDLKDMRELLGQEKIVSLVKKLRAKRHQLFLPKTSDKKKRLLNDVARLISWNPFAFNVAESFLDPEWMFGVKDGFDIVIGNPPYIQLQANGGELADLYEGCEFKAFDRTGDIYCLFYEKGVYLLSKTGCLCYITSNKWMRSGYGASLREFLGENTNPKLMIDFAGEKIFETATVDTNILLTQKGEKNNGSTVSCIATEFANSGLAEFVDNNHQEAVAKPREGRAPPRPRPRQSAALPCGNGGFATASQVCEFVGEGSI